jgi:hypothetical protein
MALIDRTAYPRLPSSVSERDLAEVFTPTDEEVRWSWAQVIEPQARLALLVMLKCYQRLGYFPQLDQVREREKLWEATQRSPAPLAPGRCG